ncbi:MAG: hypothetical protein IJZ72_00940 [Oscillospiraceae bacterium]|nr:hypothetical protein [Oscillospiraceae bacterium]
MFGKRKRHDYIGLKLAALCSCIIIGLWMFITFCAFILQDEVLAAFRCVDETTGRIILWSTIVQLIMNIPIIISCFMIIREKGGVIPLVLSGVALIVMPMMSAWVESMQEITYLDAEYQFGLIRFAAAGRFADWMTYLLCGAYIITVISAAVHYYVTESGGYSRGPLATVKKLFKGLLKAIPILSLFKK